VALVTGATGGIGLAISLALARHGARLCLIGRDPNRLSEAVEEARKFSEAEGCRGDLINEDNLRQLVRYVEENIGRLDILVHSAGVVHHDRMECASIEDLDLEYATNVRAPYLLTQQLLPMLTVAQGQIVFVNSSVGLTAKRAEVGQYAATKHALRAIADSLREEVNPKGIRVLTVYLGRTATPMQEAVCKHEGKAYHPEKLVQPADVGNLVVQVLMLPMTAEVTDISIRPMQRS
jgi:NAD(P)-dependent dehydrogenase (short-subunit alcohol dehydrogenase family)